MAVTPLERIGKKWWSASSANTWMTQPAAFVLSYVYNVRGSGNHNTARGKAAEVGYEYFMENEFAEVADAVEEAKKYFARKTALLRGDEKVQKERESIEGFITETIKALEPYGMYTSKQTQLWFDMPGIADPWMGYDDYTFPPQGDDPRPICLDLKTTHRVPSDITDNHKRQIALYQMMRPEHRILICYVSTKKSVVFEMTPDEAILLSEQFKVAAQSFERLVAAVNDPKDMAGFFAPDFSSYHWNDPIVRAEAKRIWGY
jgi:hypothetical protein